MEVELLPIVNLLADPSSVLKSWNYNFLERIGGGRVSDVYKCLNGDTDLIVAVKAITILEEEQKEGVPSSIIREISIIKELEHENIVRLLDVLNNQYDVFLIFEHVDLDLNNFIRKQTIPMDVQIVKKFLHQMLSGIAYLHSHKILHRDLKPQNVLVDLTDKIVKIADFGSAKDFNVPAVFPNTIDVGTLRYMAPEILFGSTEYSTSCDIWSVGCIFAEMVTGRPLFNPTNNLLVFREIFSLLGTPTEETWPGITSLCDFIGYFNPPTEPEDLTLKFTTLEPAGVDLLSKMLCQYPKGRISAEDALKLEFFNGIEMVRFNI